MTRNDRTSVHQDITVDVPQAQAFALFTERFDGVKPREYNLLSVPIEETVLEPWAGGSVYDRGTDGTICRWARVLAVEPPARLLMSWDITPAWELETDLDRTSEVEVRFIALSDRQTRVEIHHRHLDRHGEGWQAFREGVAEGWPVFLDNLRGLTVRADA